MKLKITVDNLDDVPEALRQYYEAQGEKFQLSLDGYEDPAALKRAKDHEKSQRKEAQEKVRELEAKITELGEELNEAKSKRGNAKDTESLEQSYKEKIIKLQAEHGEAVKKLEGTVNRLLIDSVAESMAAELSDAPELLSDLIRKRLVVKDGQTRVVDTDGDLSATTVEELREEFRSNKKYAPVIRGSQASGGGSGGGGKGGSSTKSFSEMNEKERGELLKSNPTEYHRQMGELRAASKTQY